MSTTSGYVYNRLVAGLPPRDRQRLLDICERVDLTVGDVLQEPQDRIRFVYFPISGLISLRTPIQDRGNLEVELVGSEGFLGIPIVLGLQSSTLEGLVQNAGAALRLSAHEFRRELDSRPALRRAIRRYVYVLLAQLAATAGCIKFHFLEARLARWLLMTHDRVDSNEFTLTHELLAQMLGVRRVSVTTAAGALQERNLITYSRSEITVLDRAGLEAASCRCYQSGTNIYEHTLRGDAE